MVIVGTRSIVFLHVTTRRLFSMELKKSNFVNGVLCSPGVSHRSIQKYDPATGKFLFDISCSGLKDVNAAVDCSKKAFQIWSKKSPRERGQILQIASKIIQKRIEEIARAEVLDTGKPIWEAKVDVAGCADILEYYGGIAPTISGSHYQLPGSNFATVLREPLGVVAGIGAWNYPFQVMCWKAAPALVSGNTFIYKPSELTPSSALLLAEILTEAGLPIGAVNVLQGDYETGELLCAHPGISKLTFTGSVATGQKIAAMCAGSMKRVTMELGGKSALLVFSDCDIKNAVKATLLGNFLTQGEVCSNCTRVFVQKPILREFTSQLLAATTKLKIGDPFDTNTKVGAVINEAHGKKILRYIESAKSEGATVFGGEKVTPEQVGLEGFFVTPCVITDCEDSMAVVREEIFGPVVSLLSFDSEEEAVARANSSPFGLAAGVMTRDIQRAHRVASALEAGIVWINNYNIFPPEVPFGGYKMSGYGRENGEAAINDYTQLKTVYVEMNEEIDCPLYVED